MRKKFDLEERRGEEKGGKNEEKRFD